MTAIRATRLPTLGQPVAARVVPFAVFIGFLALEPWIPEASRPWWTVARALVAGAILVAYRRSYFELRRVPRTPASEWLVAVTVGIAIFAAWITFDDGWFARRTATAGFAPLREDGTLDPLLAVLRVAGFAAIVPVMEELFWRSFVFRWLASRDFLAVDPRHAGLVPLALSAALFASEHSLWFAGLLAGVAYAWVYRRTGNLWIPIVSHAVTNGALATWILATHGWAYW